MSHFCYFALSQRVPCNTVEIKNTGSFSKIKIVHACTGTDFHVDKNYCGTIVLQSCNVLGVVV